MRPVEHSGPEFARDADEVGDDSDRDRRSKVLDEVGAAARLDRVDPLVRQGCDSRPELLYLARDEGAVDEIAEPRVLGRLNFQDRMALERVELGEMGFGRRPTEFLPAHDVQDLPAETAVPQQSRDVGVGGEAPEAVILPEEGGRLGADRGVGGVRVVEEGRVARIEAEPALARRRWSVSCAKAFSPADRPPQRHRGRRPSLRGRKRGRTARP